METIYNVDYFIKKFEVIPEQLWVTGVCTLNDKHCAVGHCGLKDGQKCEEVKEADAFIDIGLAHKICLIGVNDGVYAQYPQSNPKQRILAALYDIKIKQAKTIYVAVSEKIREDVPKVLEEVN